MAHPALQFIENLEVGGSSGLSLAGWGFSSRIPYTLSGAQNQKRRSRDVLLGVGVSPRPEAGLEGALSFASRSVCIASKQQD